MKSPKLKSKKLTLRQLRANLRDASVTWESFTKRSSKRINGVNYYARIDKFIGRWAAAVLAQGQIVTITYIYPSWYSLIDIQMGNQRGGFTEKHRSRGQFHDNYVFFDGIKPPPIIPPIGREKRRASFLQTPVIKGGKDEG